MKQPQKLEFSTTFSRYTAVRLLGEGATGQVYEVDSEDGKRLALKLLRPRAVTDDRRRRFKNEILFCQRSSHKNILSVLDHGILATANPPSPFYVMPMFDCSLRPMIKAGLTPAEILAIFSQLLDGVEAAHLLKVVHRDIKPENLLIHKTDSRLVVADFGIARFQEEELFTAVETKASDRLANFQYAAPEQRQRGGAVDHRADIYAIGLILNEMFTGEVPQGTGFKTIAQIAPDLQYLDPVVEDMIRQRPEDRPQSVSDVKQILSARGAQFVSQQRLSQLNGTVIPTTETDDILVADPIRIVDFQWANGQLTLALNHPVSARWVSAFRNMGNYSALMSKGPEVFSFHDDRAIVPAREREVQAIIDYFKGWMPLATRKYDESLKEEARRADEKQRQELRNRIQEEETRQRLRREIKL